VFAYTRERSGRVLVALGAATLLAGCGGSDSAAVISSGSDSAKQNAPTVEIVASGFGQDGSYAQGIVIVTTDNAESVGEFVTASVNFLDPAHTILKTEEQVEAFAWINQQLVLPVWLDVSATPGATVASIQPSVSISDNGDPRESRPQLPTLESEQIGETPFKGTTATFTFTNNTAQDLTDLRVGVACYDAAQTIIGGGFDYPSLVAAGQAIRIDAKVTTSGNPQHCRAFPSYGY
jgi:hypothetical protein